VGFAGSAEPGDHHDCRPADHVERGGDDVLVHDADVTRALVPPWPRVISTTAAWASAAEANACVAPEVSAVARFVLQRVDHDHVLRPGGARRPGRVDPDPPPIP